MRKVADILGWITVASFVNTIGLSIAWLIAIYKASKGQRKRKASYDN